MNSRDVYDGYVDRSWRFLAKLQRAGGIEFAVGERDGTYLWNLEHDRRLLDCGNGGGVHSLGHRNPEIRAVLMQAVEQFDAGMWSMPSPEALAFQDRIVATDPPIEDCRTVLTLSATDSIDLAVMFSFRVTGRSKVLAFRQGYHGHGGFAALVTGSDAEGLLEHYSLPRESAAFFAEYGALESIAPLIDTNCAAVIMEPMNYETFEPAPPGYLEGVAALCRGHGVMLILDETRTGLGRSGQCWMTRRYDVRPDMLILGKGLGGGYYPVSALLASREVYDACMNSTHWGFMSSMAGSPIAVHVAMKVIEIATSAPLSENVALLERALQARFASLCALYPDVFMPGWVIGGIAALGLRDEALAASIRGDLFRRDVLCHSVSEIAPRVVKFFPCLNADPAIADTLGEALAAIATDHRHKVVAGA